MRKAMSRIEADGHVARRPRMIRIGGCKLFTSPDIAATPTWTGSKRRG